MLRIVHLGLGNFHRAHQAVFTQAAGGDWAITGVANRNRGLVRALERQGMTYTVLAVDGDQVRSETVSVHDRGLVLDGDALAVVAAVADPSTRVVTLTITEAGYLLRPDGSLDRADPALASDLELLSGDAPTSGDGPRTMIGALCAGLRLRAAGGGEPLSVVSCDNLTGNGEVTSRVVGEICAAAGGSDDLLAYLRQMVSFPGTMVDRIVPATTDATRDLAHKLGYDDDVPVATEPFSQWVLQPTFAAERPAWDEVGAVITPDVAAWERVKLRMLNGAHSLLAFLGLLSGLPLIADAYQAPAIRTGLQGLWEEMAATLVPPPELDLADYRAALGRRFANRALGHRCSQVGSDGSRKLPQRLAAPILWHLDRGRMPDHLALTAAAWLAVACRDLAAGTVRDPAADLLARLGREQPDDVRLARDVLCREALLGEEVAQRTDLADRVGQLLGLLVRQGPEQTLATIG